MTERDISAISTPGVEKEQKSKSFYIYRKADSEDKMLWWKVGDLGYTTDLAEARVFSEEEIKDKQDRCPEGNRNKLAFECGYIDTISIKTRTTNPELVNMAKGISA